MPGKGFEGEGEVRGGRMLAFCDSYPDVRGCDRRIGA